MVIGKEIIVREASNEFWESITRAFGIQIIVDETSEVAPPIFIYFLWKYVLLFVPHSDL